MLPVDVCMLCALSCDLQAVMFGALPFAAALGSPIAVPTKPDGCCHEPCRDPDDCVVTEWLLGVEVEPGLGMLEPAVVPGDVDGTESIVASEGR